MPSAKCRKFDDDDLHTKHCSGKYQSRASKYLDFYFTYHSLINRTPLPTLPYYTKSALFQYLEWRKERVEKQTRTTTKCLAAKATVVTGNMQPLLPCNILLKQQTMHTKATPTPNISSLHPIMVRTSKTPVPHQWQQAMGSKRLIRFSSWVRDFGLIPLYSALWSGS